MLVANQGREALKILEEVEVDLVLLDLRMPVMDGYETVQRIRQSQSGWAQVPVVAVTAEVGKEERQRCLDMGMDGYVKKPIRMASLSQAIAKALKVRST